jgi:hypothetical protein
MAEHRRGAGFAAEAFERLSVFDERVMEHFNRYLIADVYATRAIDCAHSSLPQASDDLVLGIECLACEGV